MSMIDRAQGCLLGALIGDAAGATLEFLGRRPTEEDLDRALAMSGGGVFRLAPGQITDDGELTLALAHALIDGEGDYDLDKVAARYKAWFDSGPFDIGGTTHSALSVRVQDGFSLSEAMTQRAQAHSMGSKANGALMRASPLGIWAARQTVDKAVRVARADACLTHPNPSCQWANVAYVLAIRHLMLREGDSSGAILAARDALETWLEEGTEEVLGWLDDACAGKLPDCHPQAGYVRIAFTHAFHHLRMESSYTVALRQVLSGGGDTDTNACIVGGLVGAHCGVHEVPPTMAQAVLECGTQHGRERPVWLRTGVGYFKVARGLFGRSISGDTS
ncbi:ADP-ribosylglycohydrolase family protein [Hydrogenophaga sp.]|uniref:ADP-ribosylglycohydrolase family protein n=1 Tax=Hydrogenophaga sp. TaxID=1904254 RepID=UPI0035B18416